MHQVRFNNLINNLVHPQTYPRLSMFTNRLYTVLEDLDAQYQAGDKDAALSLAQLIDIYVQTTRAYDGPHQKELEACVITVLPDILDFEYYKPIWELDQYAKKLDKQTNI